MCGSPTTRKLASSVVAKIEDVMRERGCRWGGIVVVPATTAPGTRARWKTALEVLEGISWANWNSGDDRTYIEAIGFLGEGLYK